MTDFDAPSSPTFDDLVSSAVSRQVEEQRELRLALSLVRVGLDDLRSDATASAADIRTLTEALGNELRGMSDASAADVRGLAEALRALNAGVREKFGSLEDRADLVEERTKGLAESLASGMSALASTQQSALEGMGTVVSASVDRLRSDIAVAVRALESKLDEIRTDVAESTVAARSAMDAVRAQADAAAGEVLAATVDVRDRVSDTVGIVVNELSELRTKVAEAGDTVGYLRDQSDDLDKLLGTLNGVPGQIEAILAQALRRALTVRAGLLEEAQKALQEAMDPVRDQVGRIAKELGPGRKDSARGDEDLRRIALQQVEIETRLDDLQASLNAFVDEAAQERRDRDWVLAEAIDRAGQGLKPDAAASLKATEKTPRRAAAPRKKVTKAKPKAKAAKVTEVKVTPKGSKTTKKDAGAGKPKSGGRRRNYIPL